MNNLKPTIMETINNFWNYFNQNNFVFSLINEIPREEYIKYFNELSGHLSQYNKDLSPIIKSGNKKAELIITANGNPYLFKEVELLVSHAPVIKHWKTTALLQPKKNIEKYEDGTDEPITCYDIELRISEMYFMPLQNPKKPSDLAIAVYLKNYILHKHNPRLRDVIYTHVEYLIGEKSFANDIVYIDILQLTTNEANEPLMELCHLSGYIEFHKSRIIKEFYLNK